MEQQNNLNLLDFLHSHLFVTLPIPTKRFDGQIIIVTGANTGLGLEAARHFVHLGALKVILAVRSTLKGDAAAKSIEESTGRTGVAEVWELDLTSYDSAKAFARRASSLERLDIVVNNAGILVYGFELAEDNESSITVNAVSPMLLSLLLLPKLRETSIRSNKDTVLTFTGSFVHFMTEFPERESEAILHELAQKETAKMKTRYYVSKLVQLLMVRELASQISSSSKPGIVTVSCVNPGFVATEVMKNTSATRRFISRPFQKFFARTAEEGSRTLLHAAEGDKGTHGQYLNDCKVASPSTFVSSSEGNEIQQKIWLELAEKLEKINPGIMENV